MAEKLSGVSTDIGESDLAARATLVGAIQLALTCISKFAERNCVRHDLLNEITRQTKKSTKTIGLPLAVVCGNTTPWVQGGELEARDARRS